MDVDCGDAKVRAFHVTGRLRLCRMVRGEPRRASGAPRGITPRQHLPRPFHSSKDRRHVLSEPGGFYCRPTGKGGCFKNPSTGGPCSRGSRNPAVLTTLLQSLSEPVLPSL